MKEIKLTRGYFAKIDDEDYDYISQFSWQAIPKGNDRVYARRSKRVGPRSEGRQDHFYMHREIINAKKGEYVDHINHVTLDNTKGNLRKCTNAENSKNNRGQPSQRIHSKYKGVKKNLNSTTFSARITVDGVCLYLGSYKTQEEAAEAYNNAALEHHKEFAFLNEIKC